VLQDSTHSAGSLTPVWLSGLLIDCTQACAEYLRQHGAELVAELALADAADPSDLDIDASLNASLE
jgi:hypothetical protein